MKAGDKVIVVRNENYGLYFESAEVERVTERYVFVERSSCGWKRYDIESVIPHSDEAWMQLEALREEIKAEQARHAEAKSELNYRVIALLAPSL